MLSAVCVIALLCLVSVGQSAPLTCEELVRPLEQMDFRRLEGMWVLVAGSLSFLPNLERFKQRDSATVNFSSNTSESTTSYTRSLRLNNKCMYNTYNISLQGSSFTYEGIPQSNLSTVFVHTSCHDCILMRMYIQSGKHQHFYLFSRRRQLEQQEMDEFRAQVECLNMPPPAVMDPTKELCPEETTTSDPAAQNQEKTEEKKD